MRLYGEDAGLDLALNEAAFAGASVEELLFTNNAVWGRDPNVLETGARVEFEASRPGVIKQIPVSRLIDDEILVDETVPGFTPFDAYIGFTAATGADTNEHTIRGLAVSGGACDAFVPL